MAHNFARKIKQLAETESISIGYLITTIALYLDFENGVAEAQSEHRAENFISVFFDVNNLSGVGFRDNYNKVVVVLVIKDFTSPPPALTYFLFRFDVVGAIMHRGALSRSCTVVYLLRLPQLPYVCKTTITAPVSLRTLPPGEVPDTLTTIGRISYDAINSMTVGELSPTMKRVSDSLSSFSQLARKLFNTSPKATINDCNSRFHPKDELCYR